MARTFGLIPGAGKSRRMGQPKLLLPCGGSTVLECVIASLRVANVDEIAVVTAPDADELARVAARAGAQVVRLPEDTPDMRASCQAGLDWLEVHFQPAADDQWLLLPADHPTICSRVVIALLEAVRANPGADIVVPKYQGRRGHPTLLRWAHVAGIRALEADQGLNVYIRRHSATTWEIDWPSDEILRDLDTPEDYERLMKP